MAWFDTYCPVSQSSQSKTGFPSLSFRPSENVSVREGLEDSIERFRETQTICKQRFLQYPVSAVCFHKLHSQCTPETSSHGEFVSGCYVLNVLLCFRVLRNITMPDLMQLNHWDNWKCPNDKQWQKCHNWPEFTLKGNHVFHCWSQINSQMLITK